MSKHSGIRRFEQTSAHKLTGALSLQTGVAPAPAVVVVAAATAAARTFVVARRRRSHFFNT